MWQTRVRQVKRAVDFLGGHGGEHGVYLDYLTAMALPDGGSFVAVALLLDVLEVLGLAAFVGKTILEGMQDDVVRIGRGRHGFSRKHDGCLHDIGHVGDIFSGFQASGYLHNGFLAHSIY